MAFKIMENFHKYWTQKHGIMGVAPVLDPQYKMKLLEYYFPLLYGDEVANMEIDRIQKIFYDLITE